MHRHNKTCSADEVKHTHTKTISSDYTHDFCTYVSELSTNVMHEQRVCVCVCVSDLGEGIKEELKDLQF